MKASTQRPALAAGLVASAALHGAVLAFGVIEVPLAPAPEIRLVRPAAVPPVEAEREDPPRVVVIRPPGALPSGGSDGARGGEAAAPGLRPPPAGLAVSDAPSTTPTPRRASVVRASLALATPVAETGMTPIPVTADTLAASPPPRPGRGIILRVGPASTGTGGDGVTGSGGTRGPGGLSAGGGVATAGPGGDCITPGIAGRAVPPGVPGAIPSRAPRALPRGTGAGGGRPRRPGG